MELMRKILILLVGVILIAGVVYLVNVSYQAQKERQREYGRAEQEVLPESEEGLVDTVHLERSPADTTDAFAPPPPIIMEPETLNWRSLSNGKLEPLIDKFPYGNPNPLFIEAANRILPAVVTVQSELTVSSVPRDEDHEFFLEQRGDDEPDYFRQGTGSGIIISEDGYILTNHHVVDKASNFNIVLYDKREYKAKYIGGDPNTDVALLKVEGDNLPTAYVGNSDSVQIGEWVMAVGSPLSFSSTITAGIVSAIGRNIRIIDTEYSVENFIQTDAVINPGNSGGALVNLNGEVIGINTAIATRTGLYQGYGFAIPSNLAIKIVNDILQYGEVRRGLLGVSISNVDSRVAKGVGLPRPAGVLVQGLQPGRPAEKSGLKAGDVILEVNGDEVVSVNDLQNKIASKRPGDTVTLRIWRDERRLAYDVKLAQAPVSDRERRVSEEKRQKKFENLGMEVRNLTRMEKNSFDLESGIYVSDVKGGSPANKAGIYPGYVIYKFDGIELEDEDDFKELLRKYKKGEVIKVIARPSNFRNQLDDRILFVEID
jgi:serine protease Do